MRYLLYSLYFISILFSACSRDYELEVDQPSFDVNVSQSSFKAGDTVTFNISGKADVVSFNSGEKGNIMLTFASQTRYGTQTNQLSVQASTDYSGAGTEEAVRAATWTDISNRFVFSTSTTLLSSGTQSISDLVAEGKPLYVAFRYTGAADPNKTQKNWWVNNLRLDNILAGTTTGLVTQATADWQLVNFAANATGAAWSRVADGRILFDPAGSTIASEGWAVAKRIFPDSLKSVPAPIKAVIDAQMTQYNYVFTDPGTYTVTFDASNVTAHEKKSVTRELQITITP